jgi:hypothetical protein
MEVSDLSNKGSNKDIMSLAYARAMGYYINCGLESRILVIIGNGSTI